MFKEIRSVPVRGGSASYAESFYDPTLKEYGTRLLDSLNWHGVANVEFKQEKSTGRLKLMEVNPRFWGSLQLAIVSGVDFPWLMLRTALGETFPPVLDYQVNKQCRWLLFGDILHFFKNPGRFHPGLQTLDLEIYDLSS